MTFTDAAREVLRMVGRPLHYKEITEIAIEKNLLSHVGKSPDVTMGARLAATLKKEGDDNPLVRVKPGVFALREWDDETIRQGLDVKRNGAKAPNGDEEPLAVEAPEAASADEAEEEPEEEEHAGPDAGPPAGWDHEEEPAEVAALSVRSGPDSEEDEEWQAPSADEELRAEMAAAATELFEEEEDDDQPILRPVTEPTAGGEEEGEAAEGGGEPAEGRRRRRRRRRRGAPRTTGPEAEAVSGDDEGLPSYTTSPAFDVAGDAVADAGHRGPQVIEVAPGEAPSPDTLAGRDLADAVAMILGTFDRTVGAVSLRQIAETAQRRGKLAGDTQSIQSQIAAATRADNSRRIAAGLRPRFRLAGGRVGLTDWLLDPELTRLERDALNALGRYRDAARRAFARKLGELPGHAFVELCLLVLERVGAVQLRQVKFPGASGVETHFSAVLHAPAGPLGGPVGAGEGVRVAIVIRRDGRDVGRERVTELRGTTHHYGPVNIGWILTSGQILSGAREEASVSGVFPVTLLDGLGIARICEDHGLAVVQAMHPIGIPDVDLFEALRSS